MFIRPFHEDRILKLPFSKNFPTNSIFLKLGATKCWRHNLVSRFCIYNDLSSSECWECGEKDRITNKLVFDNKNKLVVWQVFFSYRSFDARLVQRHMSFLNAQIAFWWLSKTNLNNVLYSISRDLILMKMKL